MGERKEKGNKWGGTRKGEKRETGNREGGWENKMNKEEWKEG